MEFLHAGTRKTIRQADVDLLAIWDNTMEKRSLNIHGVEMHAFMCCCCDNLTQRRKTDHRGRDGVARFSLQIAQSHQTRFAAAVKFVRK